MDPSSLSCPNLACPDKGAVGAGNVRIHARAEGRYRCRTCRRTCAATTNTPLYRVHHPEATMTLVLTLLSHGCPIPAIVAAVGVDARTVRAWLHKAGGHAALLQDQLVGGVEARQAQADEIRVRVRGGAVWAALALDVGSRLWLATAVAQRRDGLLVHLLRLAYHYCGAHESLRLRAIGTPHRWVERTPALAAGLADHPCALDALLRMPAPPVPLTAPAAPRRGRPSARGRVLPFPSPASAPPERSAA